MIEKGRTNIWENFAHPITGKVFFYYGKATVLNRNRVSGGLPVL